MPLSVGRPGGRPDVFTLEIPGQSTDPDVDAVVGLLQGCIGVVHVSEVQIKTVKSVSHADPVFELEVGGQVAVLDKILVQVGDADAAFHIGIPCLAPGIEGINEYRAQGHGVDLVVAAVPPVVGEFEIPVHIPGGVLQPPDIPLFGQADPVNINTVVALAVSQSEAEPGVFGHGRAGEDCQKDQGQYRFFHLFPFHAFLFCHARVGLR